MKPDLTDDDKAILVELLREVIAGDRFPLAPKVRSFKAVLTGTKASIAFSLAGRPRESSFSPR